MVEGSIGNILRIEREHQQNFFEARQHIINEKIQHIERIKANIEAEKEKKRHTIELELRELEDELRLKFRMKEQEFKEQYNTVEENAKQRADAARHQLEHVLMRAR